MSILSQPQFHDEAAAFAYVEAALWPNGPVCPHCGCTSRVSALAPFRGSKSKKNPEGALRVGVKFCGDCRQQFTVRVGTIFEETKLPMTKWLQAIYLMSSSKKGVSAHQLHRMLETTYKTAWFLAHRIREAMSRPSDLSPLGGFGKFVEADETYVGGREKNKHANKRRPGGEGGRHMAPVVTLIERGGQARSFHVANVTGANVRPLVAKHAHRLSVFMTDEAPLYKGIGQRFRRHEAVTHGAGEYARGDAHSNTAESFFAILKRGIYGTFHHVSEAHLHRYLAEFDFRYNNRVALGIGDSERADAALRGAAGKRLTYRQPDL